jgi:hypothetical protein
MNLKSKINKAYWQFEGFLDKAFFYGVVPFILLCLFVFFTHLSYMTDKSRDFSVLPKEVMERHNYVCSEELRLWQRQSVLQQEFQFDKAKEVNKIRGPLRVECNEIAKSAPRKSWGYNFYVATGIIDPKIKDSIW